jgi:hypothetical protein
MFRKTTEKYRDDPDTVLRRCKNTEITMLKKKKKDIYYIILTIRKL